MGPPPLEVEVEVGGAVVAAAVVADIVAPGFILLLFCCAPFALSRSPSLSSLEATIREVSPSLRSPRDTQLKRRAERGLFFVSFVSTAKEESSATATDDDEVLKMPFEWFLSRFPPLSESEFLAH